MKFSNLQLAKLSSVSGVPGYESGIRSGDELLCARSWHTADSGIARDVRFEDPMN